MTAQHWWEARMSTAVRFRQPYGPRPAGPIVVDDIEITGSTSTEVLRAALPATWRPTPPLIRGTVPAFCTRCDRLARLPFGGGDALCDPCRAGEQAARVDDAVQDRWGTR